MADLKPIDTDKLLRQAANAQATRATSIEQRPSNAGAANAQARTLATPPVQTEQPVESAPGPEASSAVDTPTGEGRIEKYWAGQNRKLGKPSRSNRAPSEAQQLFFKNMFQVGFNLIASGLQQATGEEGWGALGELGQGVGEAMTSRWHQQEVETWSAQTAQPILESLQRTAGMFNEQMSVVNIPDAQGNPIPSVRDRSGGYIPINDPRAQELLMEGAGMTMQAINEGVTAIINSAADYGHNPMIQKLATNLMNHYEGVMKNHLASRKMAMDEQKFATDITSKQQETAFNARDQEYKEAARLPASTKRDQDRRLTESMINRNNRVPQSGKSKLPNYTEILGESPEVTDVISAYTTTHSSAFKPLRDNIGSKIMPHILGKAPTQANLSTLSAEEQAKLRTMTDNLALRQLIVAYVDGIESSAEADLMIYVAGRQLNDESLMDLSLFDRILDSYDEHVSGLDDQEAINFERDVADIVQELGDINPTKVREKIAEEHGIYSDIFMKAVRQAARGEIELKPGTPEYEMAEELRNKDTLSRLTAKEKSLSKKRGRRARDELSRVRRSLKKFEPAGPEDPKLVQQLHELEQKLKEVQNKPGRAASQTRARIRVAIKRIKKKLGRK